MKDTASVVGIHTNPTGFSLRYFCDSGEQLGKPRDLLDLASTNKLIQFSKFAL
jgi:hypothetical protein